MADDTSLRLPELKEAGWSSSPKGGKIRPVSVPQEHAEHAEPEKADGEAQDAQSRSFQECNPKHVPDRPSSVWLHKGGTIQSQVWDPGEWVWKRTGLFKETPFFGYTVRRGYKEGMRKRAQVPIAVQEMKNQLFSEQEIKKTFQLLWHSSRPRKQAMFVWQVLNRSIVTGDWLSWRIPTARLDCVNCSCELETIPHLFWDCGSTRELWGRFNSFARSANAPIVNSIQEAFLGRFSSIKYERYVFQDQPWNLMRTFLIWHLWKEKCGSRYGNQSFSLQRVLASVWIATIHAGMALWGHIHSVVRNQETLVLIENAFSEQWTPLFCNSGGGIWHFSVPPVFQ